MPVQSFAFELKSLGDGGQFRGLASTYNNIDQGGDVCIPGCFTRTLQDSGKQRPLMWQHSQPIGLVTLADSPAGLVADGVLSLGVQLAKDAYVLLKDGVVKGMSIGFQTITEKYVGEVRQLLECKLFEVSLTPFPMNELATVTAVKSLQHQRDEIRRAAGELKESYENLTRNF